MGGLPRVRFGAMQSLVTAPGGKRMIRSLIADRERLLFALAATVIPVLLCGWMFGFDIMLAGARYWTLPRNDMAAMQAGWEAFARQPWHWPLTTVNGLLDKPVSIVFTDSLPWMSLVLKATGLGRWLNPMGLFLFLSYPLQVWSMIVLLRTLGVADRWTLLIGGLLALLFPAWIARQFGHVALCGHWIILLALALSVSSARWGLSLGRACGFAALAALAAGIHVYQLIPIGAAMGAAMLAEVLQRRADGFWRGVMAAGLTGWTLFVCARLLDYESGMGATGGAGALGVWSMNLVGPFWPQASPLLGQVWNGSWFVNAYDPTGGQAFEGFQYLGMGALLLILAMAGFELAAAVRARGVSADFWLRWTPMILAMVGLTVWSLGWSVYAYKTHLFDLPRPKGELAELVGAFRAYGRFFWAVGYLLIALAVTWAGRLPRKVGLAVLGATLALQAVDTAYLRQGVRHVFDGPDAPAYPLALTASPETAGRPWVFSPTYFCSPSLRDLRVYRQMNLAIVRNGGTSDSFATARSAEAPCERPRPDIAQDAAPGDRRITVVMRAGQTRGGFLKAIAERSDCYWFGPGVACGRDLAGVPGLRPLLRGEVAGAP